MRLKFGKGFWVALSLFSELQVITSFEVRKVSLQFSSRYKNHPNISIPGWERDLWIQTWPCVTGAIFLLLTFQAVSPTHLKDPCGSLPAWNILWSVKRAASSFNIKMFALLLLHSISTAQCVHPTTWLVWAEHLSFSVIAGRLLGTS